MGNKIEDFEPHVQKQIRQRLKEDQPKPAPHVEPQKPRVVWRDGEERTVYAHVVPMGKPRMTQRDKWKKRPVVVKYRAYADEIRRQIGDSVPQDVLELSWAAYFPMPKSWSKKKKEAMYGQPHRVKPDIDNICKGIYDILLKQDSVVAICHAEKRWIHAWMDPHIRLTWRIS